MPSLIGPITRAAAPVINRGDVRQGMAFAVKQRDGRLGRTYLAVGCNGRAYSVNLNTGEVASAAKMDRKVSVIGSWAFDVDRTFRMGTRVGQQVRRSDVRAGELFVVANGTREYAHLGRITKDHNGWLSLPLANPENHAVTENGNSNVTIVGTFRMMPTLTK